MLNQFKATLLSVDSSLKYTSVAVFPQENLVEKQLEKREWIQDIYLKTKEYKQAFPYKEEAVNVVFAESWMLLLLLLCIGSLAFVRGFYRKRFSMLFQTLINWKLSKQIIRYEKVYTHPVNLLLLANFVICIPLFFSVAALKVLDIPYSAIKVFLFILAPLLLYLLAKFIGYQFSAWLLKEKEAINEYVFQANLFNKYLGVLFLVLVTLLIYSPIDPVKIIYLGFFILIFFLVFQLIRGVIIGIQRAKNLLFIILYLCTLEILPWLILGKWLNNLH